MESPRNEDSGQQVVPPTTEEFVRTCSPRALVLDFDGVFTDNRVMVAADGTESVFCDRSDGFAIAALRRQEFPILVLSTETTPMVRLRCQKLGLECIHSAEDKLSALKGWLQAKGLSAEGTIYVGNDVNDLTCMEYVGLPCAVSDAYPEARAAAKHILTSLGGRGAVREIARAIYSGLDRQMNKQTSVGAK